MAAHTVVGFWFSTVEADVAEVEAADAAAATLARQRELAREDGTLPGDWFYVATFGPDGAPALAAWPRGAIGRPEIEDWPGEGGEPVWVIGLSASTAAARIIRIARPTPLESVERVLEALPGGDLQFVAALDGENRAVHTCESFDVRSVG